MKVAYFFLAITCIVSGAVQAGSPAPEILVTALRGMLAAVALRLSFSELKREIRWEARQIAPDLFVEPLRRDAIQLDKIRIEKNALSTQSQWRLRDMLGDHKTICPGRSFRDSYSSSASIQVRMIRLPAMHLQLPRLRQGALC